MVIFMHFSHFYKIKRLDTQIDYYGILHTFLYFICTGIELNADISFDTFEIFCSSGSQPYYQSFRHE